MKLQLVRKADGTLSSASLAGDGAWCINLNHSFFPGRAFELQYSGGGKRHTLNTLFTGFGRKVQLSAVRWV